MKHITQSFKTIALALVLALGVSYVSAWTAPDTAPPGGNTATPINTSDDLQEKIGTLMLTKVGVTPSLETYGDTFLAMAQGSNVGIGTTNPGTRLEVQAPTGITEAFNTAFRGRSNNGANHIDLNIQNDGTANLGGNFTNFGIGTINPMSKLSVDGIIETTGGIKFPDNTVQTTSSTNSSTLFVTGTYIGSGVTNRKVVIGFDPDYVVVNHLDVGGYAGFHRSKFSALPTQSQALSNYLYYPETILSLTTGQGANGGFTVGNSDYVNTVGVTYVYTATKGGTLPQVGPVIIDSLTVSPTIIAQGQSTTISWSTTGATYCTGGGIWSGNKLASGSEGIAPNAGIQTITLTCYNSDASLSATKSVTVDVRPWKNVTALDGNFGESCNAWLARVGQQGVNSSEPSGSGQPVFGCYYADNGSYGTWQYDFNSREWNVAYSNSPGWIHPLGLSAATSNPPNPLNPIVAGFKPADFADGSVRPIASIWTIFGPIYTQTRR